MTTIEAVAVVPAEPGAVWSALLDQENWAQWSTPSASARLERVDIRGERFQRIGDRRRCSGVLTRLPLVRQRRVVWEEHLTDIADARTLEVEVVTRQATLRRWRVRVWLMEQPDGQTRVRCYVSYEPSSPGAWLVDRLFVRHRLHDAAGAWLASLADSFKPAVEGAPVSIGDSGEAADGSEPEEIGGGAPRTPVAA